MMIERNSLLPGSIGEVAYRERYPGAGGSPLASTQTGEWPGALGGNRGLTTKEPDPAAGLYYFSERLYDPQTAKFTSRTPYPPDVEEPYGFAANTPVTYSDPRGENYGPYSMGSEPLTTRSHMVTQGDCCDLPPQPSIRELRDKLSLHAYNIERGLTRCIRRQFRSRLTRLLCGPCGGSDRIDADQTYGWTFVGTQRDPTRFVRLCSDGPWQGCSTRDMARIVIHQLAHTCGWRHHGGPQGPLPVQDVPGPLGR